MKSSAAAAERNGTCRFGSFRHVDWRDDERPVVLSGSVGAGAKEREDALCERVVERIDVDFGFYVVEGNLSFLKVDKYSNLVGSEVEVDVGGRLGAKGVLVPEGGTR